MGRHHIHVPDTPVTRAVVVLLISVIMYLPTKEVVQIATLLWHGRVFEGEVVALRSSRSDSNTKITGPRTPTVKYIDGNGKTRFYNSKYTPGWNRYKIGDKVLVIVEERAEIARIYDLHELTTALQFILVFLGITVFAYFSQKRILRT